MGLIDAFIAGLGLSMDAFAVSVGKGLSQKKINIINMLVIALFFGFFQFAMPVVGYFFCRQFAGFIESFDHWIAFILLVFLGAKMIFECLKEDDKVYKLKEQTMLSGNLELQTVTNVETNNLQMEETKSNFINQDTTQVINQNIKDNSNIKNNQQKDSKKKLELDIKELFILALATSIDALITGVTFAFNSANIFLTAGIIGIITFIICCIGFLIGNFFGSKFKKVAEIFGGVVLILLGIKFLLEGYGIISLGF